MVFVSPRSMCESYRRRRQSGWKDPNDRLAPGNLLRVKTDVGYTLFKFRYDLPIPVNLFNALHPDDVKKLKKEQIPSEQRSKKTKAKRRTK